MSLTLIAMLIGALASTLTSILSGNGVISGSLQTLITQLIAFGGQLFTAFTAGSSATTELNATLGTLQQALQDLQTDTSADPTVISQVQELIKMLEDGIAAEQRAQLVTDPSTLTPLDPIG